MDPVYLTELMGGIGKCVLSIECVVSSIPILKYVFGLSGYMALLRFGPIWGDLVVTCTCRGPCAGLEVLCDAYG